MSALREACIAMARDAGAAIMQIYAQDFEVVAKSDASPLTAADMASHRIICAGLAALTPDIPVLSEESASIDWTTRSSWSRYWLVDPLDGTREFVKKNGEFTVNIALIDGDASVMGVVFAPALDYLVHGERGVGAFVRNGTDDAVLRTRKPAPTPMRVAASRSHLDARTAAALEKMGPTERIGMGSSLKFCRIAEGTLDVYPRFGPTSEWDTGAAQCVLEAAGGAVLTLDGKPLRYNTKDSLLNSDFIALGDTSLNFKAWLDG